MKQNQAKIQRRGSYAIEFALILPVVVALGAGIVDWGWYLHVSNTMVHIVGDAARTGSDTPIDDGPESSALAAASAAWEAAALPGEPEFQAELTGNAAPNQMIVVEGRLLDPALLGLVPLPDVVVSTVTMRLNDQ